MNIEQFTPNHTGYELLCRHLMTALHKELIGSKFSDKPADEWLYQQLDLANGQCIRFTKWDGRKSKKPFFLVLCKTNSEASKVLEFDMSNIAFNNKRFTWYLRSPQNNVSKEFLQIELGKTVKADDDYRSSISEVKAQLISGENTMANGHEFLTQATLSELITQFCRLVKLTFEWHADKGADEDNILGDSSDSTQIESDDMSSFILALRRVRQHQGPFKKGLLNRYSGKCVVTDCSIKSILIAAHIKDHAACGVNDLDNGLLLRTDIHALYDAGLLKIEINKLSPENSLLITLNEEIATTPDYQQFHNKVIKFSNLKLMPNKDYLMWKNKKHK